MDKIEHTDAGAIGTLRILLGLKPYCQDWDIELADPHRIEEFLALYESGTLSEMERFALMALIIASFDELLGLARAPERIWRRIRWLLIRDRMLHEATIEYWSCYEPDTDGFLATPYIRQMKIIRSVRSKDGRNG